MTCCAAMRGASRTDRALDWSADQRTAACPREYLFSALLFADGQCLFKETAINRPYKSNNFLYRF
jgi:hypothetical protein